MARNFISSADGVFESAGDVNTSDNGSRFKVNNKVIRHAAMFAVTAVMFVPILPIAGGVAGAGMAKAARELFGKLI